MRLARLFLRRAWRVSSASSGLSSTSSISTLFSSMEPSSHRRGAGLPGPLEAFQREEKCRAFVHFRLGPDAAVVLVDDALHGHQSHSGALKIFGAMEPLEDAEQFVGVLHAETHAIVPDEDHAVAVAFGLAEFDDGGI